MGISDREIIINRLLSFPRVCTRNAPGCRAETALKGLQLSEELDYQLGRAYAYLALGECALYDERDGASGRGVGGTTDASGCTVGANDASGAVVRANDGAGIGDDTGNSASKGTGIGDAAGTGATGAYEQILKAKDIFSGLGDEEGCMLANLALGAYLSDHSLYPGAEAAFNEAMNAAAGDIDAKLYGNVMIDALCGVGSIRVAQLNNSDARFYYNKALGHCREKRNESKYAGVMYKLGILEFICGNEDDAMRLLTQSLDFAMRCGENRTAASASRALSRIYFESGRYEEYEHFTELASRHAFDAAKDEAGNEIKNLRSFYVKENARIIANAEQHLRERMLERNLQLEEANWQLNTIYNIGQSITALLDIGEVLRTLYTELLALMQLDSFFIAAYNEYNNTLEYQILYEDGQEASFETARDRLAPAGDLAYWCVYNDDTLVINDYENEKPAYDKAAANIASGGRVFGEAAGAEQDYAEYAGYNSAVYTCLRTKGKLFGVLCVRSRLTNAYSMHQVKLLDAVSSYVSIALDNATIYQKLDEVSRKVAELANHDTLTGIPNRRLLMELVAKAYAGALRSHSKVAFLFMDLDNFKPINDRYGHQAGDDVLKIFRDRVMGLIRSTDIFARMGGDEFVVVMTDLKISLNAGTLARKIIREVSKPIIINNAPNSIGVSIGISIYPDDSKDTDVLIVMADEAMYRVKRDFKNNFTFFNEMIV